jgi:hypothetical protein
MPNLGVIVQYALGFINLSDRKNNFMHNLSASDQCVIEISFYLDYSHARI